MAGFAPSQISSFNAGEEAFKNQIVPGSKIPQSGGGGGGMGGNVDSYFKAALGGEGIDIATSSIDAVSGILKGAKGGIFEDCDIFACADGSLAIGKLLPPDYLEVAKKSGLKIDYSPVKETGANLGAMGFSSAGQSQGG